MNKSLDINIIEAAIKDYKDGWLLQDILYKYGISSATLFKYICKYNVLTRIKNENWHDFGKRVHTFNYDYFSIINTEEKAYWLGFLYADGNIQSNDKKHNISIRLQKSDKLHLEKFKKSLEANTTPIKKYIKNLKIINGYTYKNHISYAVYLNSKKTVKDLINLGCVPNKSLIIQFPTNEQVPEKLIFHFIRGFVDGDGTIRYSIIDNRKQFSFALCGPFDFLQTVVKIFESKLGIKSVKIIKQKSIYRIKYGGNNNIGNIYHSLYKDATIYLDRKYKIYLEYNNLDVNKCGGINDWRAKTYYFLNSDGKEIIIQNLREFCRNNSNFNRKSLTELANGKIKVYKGLKLLKSPTGGQFCKKI